MATHTRNLNIPKKLLKLSLDFIKIKIVDTPTILALWEHPLLYFHSKDEVLLKDKETIHTKNKKQYKGIQFELTPYCIYICFKPHYFYNDNKHNANDFSIKNCIKTLTYFTNLFSLDAKYLDIINIEFGLNIIIPKKLICIKELLLLLAYHERNEFYTDKRYPFTRYSTTSNINGKANQYKIIKAYAKGIQYPKITDINTFRFEVKSNRRPFIKSLNIKTLKDLLNPGSYQTLEQSILNEFDKVLILDDTVTPKLSKTKLNTHIKRHNPITWHRYLQKSRNLFRKNFKDYYKSLETCETHLKKELKLLIQKKLQELKKGVHILTSI
ncbi:hypothetical protein [Olleya namhaensis]|uniref:hypothetical protein n=1 Tax=Olleya namhaensis TaxID=1144750 RepID=UPI002493237A|nr:hypothetical protein [Olleya namhaensis]